MTGRDLFKCGGLLDMLEFFSKLATDALGKVTQFVSAHVFKSIGTTIAVTILVIALLASPVIGSSWFKYHVFDYMVAGEEDIEYILERSSKDEDLQTSLREGARAAGYYVSGDKNIVSTWEQDFTDPSIGYDITKLDKTRYEAILEARRRAETRRAPFQPVGMVGYASSPSCTSTRPAFNEIYANSRSQLGGSLAPGQIVKILRKDGVGRPVIAKVNKIPSMPDNIDLYLNRRQMIDYLAWTEPIVPIQVMITDEAPNQDEQDRYLPDVEIDCTLG